MDNGKEYVVHDDYCNDVEHDSSETKIKQDSNNDDQSADENKINAYKNEISNDIDVQGPVYQPEFPLKDKNTPTTHTAGEDNRLVPDESRDEDRLVPPTDDMPTPDRPTVHEAIKESILVRNQIPVENRQVMPIHGVQIQEQPSTLVSSPNTPRHRSLRKVSRKLDRSPLVQYKPMSVRGTSQSEDNVLHSNSDPEEAPGSPYRIFRSKSPQKSARSEQSQVRSTSEEDTTSSPTQGPVKRKFVDHHKKTSQKKNKFNETEESDISVSVNSQVESVSVWQGDRRRGTADVVDLDVILTGIEDYAKQYRDQVMSPICKKAINHFMHYVSMEIIRTIDTLSEVKLLEKSITKLNSKKHSLRQELLASQQEYNSLKHEVAVFEAHALRKTALRPLVDKYNTVSSHKVHSGKELMESLKQAHGHLKSLDNLKTVNDRLDQLLHKDIT